MEWTASITPYPYSMCRGAFSPPPPTIFNENVQFMADIYTSKQELYLLTTTDILKWSTL